MFDKSLLIEGSLPPLELQEFNDLRSKIKAPGDYEMHLDEFKRKAQDAFVSNQSNRLTGFDAFPITDVIVGCQQFVDNLISKNGINGIQIFEHDYHYYNKINPNMRHVTLDTLTADKPLLIALPFPGYLGPHPQFEQIIDKCNQENIDVHIDCAWMPCAFDVDFDFDQPCVKSFAMSFSKAYALNWNKMGIRWSRHADPTDSITILNSTRALPRLSMYVAEKYMESFPIDYAVRKHKVKYFDVVKSLRLRPSNIIHACHSLDRSCLYGLKNFFD